jgi:transcription initiation factor IIE alpha subunit
MSNLELGVTTAATVIGPVVAVLLSVWMQSRMEARQREFQTQFTEQTEKDRRKYEMAREDAQAKYIDAWKIADRDRVNQIKHEIKRIADALEKEP